MQHGFIKVGAAVPLVSVADPKYNVEQLIALAHRAHEEGAEVTVFPELCITGYTCGDLLTQQTLLRESEEAVARFAAGEDKRGLVIDCVQRGYKLGEHVLRYAKVVVGE